MGVAHPLGEALEALPGDAHPAGVAVVDEDGGLLGLAVHRRGQAADVPAVAHGEERQQGDEGVLDGVDGARAGATSSASAGNSSAGMVNHRLSVTNSWVGRSSSSVPSTSSLPVRFFWKATTRLVTAIWPRCSVSGPCAVCRLSLMMRVSVSRRGSV